MRHTFRISPFLGMDRNVSPADRPDGLLFDARGVFFREHGRLLGAYEDTTPPALSQFGNLNGPPDRCVYWPDATMFWAVEYQNGGAADSELSNSGTYTSRAGGSGHGDNDDCSAVVYRGRLFVFHDEQPARVFHADNKAGSVYAVTPVNGTAHDYLATGPATFLGLSYYNTGTVGTTSGAAGLTGSSTDFRVWHGGNDNVTNGLGIITFSTEPNNWNSDTIGKQSYFFSSVTDATNATLDANADAARDKMSYKIINAGQQAMLRYPAVWKDRLVAVEGRKYDMSLLNFGSSNATGASQSGITVTFAGASVDIRDEDLRVGDEIIIADNTGDVADPNLVKNDAWTVATVASIDSATTVTADESQTLSTARNFFVRRQLTDRNTLYFLGDPGDPSVPTSPDSDDWTYVNTNLTLKVGDPSEDGEIVRLFPLEDRLYVFCERSVWVVSGTPPIDPNILPPDLRVDRVAKIGIPRYGAVDVREDGQTFWMGTLDGLYELTGVSTRRVDDRLRNFSTWKANTVAGPISQVTFADNRIFVVGKASTSIWIYHTLFDAWTWTERRQDGVQLVTLGGEAHANVFAPLRWITDGTLGADKAFLSWSNGTDTWGITAFLDRDQNPEDNDVTVHDMSIKTRIIEAKGGVNVRRVYIRTSRNLPSIPDMRVSTDLPSAGAIVEGGSAWTRTAVSGESVNESTWYQANGSGGRGFRGVQVTLGEGRSGQAAQSRWGRLDELEVDVEVNPWRTR